MVINGCLLVTKEKDLENMKRKKCSGEAALNEGIWRPKKEASKESPKMEMPKTFWDRGI